MMSITDPNMSEKFSSALEEIHNKHLETYAKVVDATAELTNSHRQFVKSALDTCLKKVKDDEMLFETIQTFSKDVEQKNLLFRAKRHAISEVVSEIQEKEMQKEDIIQKIEKLKEEQAKRTELIESQNKANKERLRNLQKARGVFHDHLGMEIRTIRGKTEQEEGKKLQFVFRNINPSKQDSAYVITMGIKENGTYQIVSSDPTLECLSVLESQLQETNNLPAFLAKVRKEFISQARCSSTVP